MNETQAPVDSFLEKFVNYAKGRPDIRAAIVVGSRARTVQPADELSDIDFMLITTNPKRYLSAGWLHDLGRPWLTWLIENPVGSRNVLHAVFDGPVVVDFAVVSSLETRWASPLLRLLARAPKVVERLPRGLSAQIEAWFEIQRRGRPLVLLDKDGSASRLYGGRVPPRVSRPPSPRDFAEVVGGFWSLSMWKCKQALRGELWMASYVCDPQLKALLLQMLEWHARAARGWDYETWYTGRFLERWADPRAVAALPDTFARYDEEDIRRALFATMDLFGWLARETAGRLRFAYPELAEERVREWVSARFAERADTVGAPTSRGPG